MAKKELTLDDKIVRYVIKYGCADRVDMSAGLSMVAPEDMALLETRVNALVDEGVLKPVMDKKDKRNYSEHSEYIPYELDYGSFKEDFRNMWKRVKSVFGYST